jgi:hypothetical protein
VVVVVVTVPALDPTLEPALDPELRDPLDRRELVEWCATSPLDDERCVVVPDDATVLAAGVVAAGAGVVSAFARSAAEMLSRG